nr:MAG TPA: hypothetical protein [Caudoviricetes sp.]
MPEIPEHLIYRSKKTIIQFSIKGIHRNQRK